MRVWLLAFLLLGLGLKGQEREVIPIETFPINAKVLFTLQGTDDRAVLRVEKVDPNPYGIEIGDTLLFTFYWSTQAIKSDLATLSRTLIGRRDGRRDDHLVLLCTSH